MSSAQQFQPPDADQMRVHRPLSGEPSSDEEMAEVEQVMVNGREYLVFPLIAAREMVLDYPENGTRELLPARHLQESVSLWAGTPITFVHPENERQTADDPREYTQTIIGQAYQPQLKDKEKLRVMAYIDVAKAEDFGGLAETVVQKLKDGEPLGVSAGYATLNDDHSGGAYNGQEYDVEQGYVIPDHIAIFPNDQFKARCDWDDGCGAPRVNYTVRQNELSTARRPTYDGLTSAEWNPPSFTDYMEAWYADHEPDPPDNLTVENVRQDALDWAARRTLVGDPEGDTADEVISFQVVNTDGELNENALNSARNLAFNSVAQDSIMEITADLLENAPENSGEWPSGASYNFSRENAESDSDRTFPDHLKDKFEDEEDALARAEELGCSDTHQDEDGNWMPCESHDAYEEALEAQRRENRLTACDVAANYDVDRPAAETVRTLVNEYNRSESLAEFKDRLDGSEPLGVTNAEQVYAMLDEAPDRMNLREGQYVQWDWSGGTSQGQIVEIVDAGSRSAGGNERSVEADDPEQIAVIDHLSEDGESQDQRVVKYVRPDGSNEDNLRSWDAPSSARSNEELLEFEEGDIARLQAIPDVWGRIVHIPNEGNGQVMFDLYDADQFVMTVGMDDLMPVEQEAIERDADGTVVNIPSATEEYTLTRSGEYVTWDTGAERRHGQVVGVADDGCLSAGGSERCAESGDGNRVVKVQVYSNEGEPLDEQVLKLVRREAPNEGNLRSWNAPRRARMNNSQDETEDESEDMNENAEEDPATLFQRFLKSIGYDKGNAASAEELMDEVEQEDGTTENQTEDTEEQTEPDDGEQESVEDLNDTSQTSSSSDDEDESDDSEGESEPTDDDSTEDTETDDGDTSDDEPTRSMKENQADELSLEEIAAKTAFGVTELEEMDDQMVAALERTVIEMSDDVMPESEQAAPEGGQPPEGGAPEGGQPAGAGTGQRANTDGETTENTESTMDDNEETETENTESSGEETTVNTDDFLTQEEAEEQFASAEDVEEVNENVEQIKGMVQNIQDQNESDQKEEKARMVANAIEGMSVEAAKSLPEDELDDLAETHATRTNYAGVPGQMERQVTTNTQEDVDDYPAGGRSHWEQSKAEGGD